MQRLRYSIRSLMALPLVVSLLLWAVMWFEGWGGSRAKGTGSKTVPLDLLVVDAADGTPIRSAVIRFVDPDPPSLRVPDPPIITGEDGRARYLYRHAQTYISRYYPPIGPPHQARVRVDYWFDLRVEAEGYSGRAVHMEALARSDVRLHGDAPPVIMVRLEKRAPAP